MQRIFISFPNYLIIKEYSVIVIESAMEFG